MWQLGLALAALCLGAAFIRDRCVLGVAATLLANWTINTVFAWATGEPASWGFFLGVDYASGIFALVGVGLICQRFTVGSIVIAISYAAECLMHAAYGLSDQGEWAQYRYWWATYYTAIAQLMFVFGWGAYEWARRSVRDRRRVSPRPLGLAGSERSMPPQEP